MGNMEQLKHLYISPLEQCNLNCRMCYTAKTRNVLDKNAILDFVDRYRAENELQTVTFCGGEVFLLPDFPGLINEIIERGIFVQVITNGTVDRLAGIERPNECCLIVSLDGKEEYHDSNRGPGNYQRSLTLMKKALEMGFHVDVFSIVTKQNLLEIEDFERELAGELGFLPGITYHPRKPWAYLQGHPLNNILGQVEGFDFLEMEEIEVLAGRKKVFPPRELGCFQVSLMSDGLVYGCCEGIEPLGKKDDEVATLIENLKQRIDYAGLKSCPLPCQGCVEAAFKCGLK